jgi:hypothetical protein
MGKRKGDVGMGEGNVDGEFRDGEGGCGDAGGTWERGSSGIDAKNLVHLMTDL